MLKKTKSFVFTALLSFISITLFAQEEGGKAEMADTMRSNGKIYVVVAVCLTILIGLLLYLIRLDRKISKMEKSVGGGQ
jgi:hypothetical protein